MTVDTGLGYGITVDTGLGYGITVDMGLGYGITVDMGLGYRQQSLWWTGVWYDIRYGGLAYGMTVLTGDWSMV
jgi:hypothetical protein